MTKAACAVPLVYRYGLHRVRGATRVLPQAAWSVENGPDWGNGADYELLLDVERLNIDAASFRQMEEAARTMGDDVVMGVQTQILSTVRERGKMHNPKTGSGGMLLGRVRRVGAGLGLPHSSLRVGERVATLVSLSLTPLDIEKVLSVNLAAHQVSIIGTAVLFDSGSWARRPSSLPETAALSALDVAGAAPQVSRLCKDARPGKQVERVLVLGAGGKSGLLVGAAARRAGASCVVGVEPHEPAAQEAETIGVYDRVVRADASDALAVAETTCSDGEYDLVVSCVSGSCAEMAAILCCRPGGTVYFFSMATSFTAAALGAEGVSRDIDMLIGNGYCVGHADETLQLLSEHAGLRELFVRRYG